MMTSRQNMEKFSREQLIQAIEDLHEALFEFDLYTKMCEGCGVVSDKVRMCEECGIESCSPDGCGPEQATVKRYEGLPKVLYCGNCIKNVQ